MTKEIAKKIVILLTDEEFLDSHTKIERAYWVRRIYNQEMEKTRKKRGIT